MNTLQKTIFAIMDWMTDGALSERNKLRVQVAGAVAKTLVPETANRELVLDEISLHHQINQRIRDLEYKLSMLKHIQNQLHAEQRKRMEGLTGAQMGLHQTKKC